MRRLIEAVVRRALIVAAVGAVAACAAKQVPESTEGAAPPAAESSTGELKGEEIPPAAPAEPAAEPVAEPVAEPAAEPASEPVAAPVAEPPAAPAPTPAPEASTPAKPKPAPTTTAPAPTPAPVAKPAPTPAPTPTPAPAAVAAPTKQAERQWKAKCGSCHGADGKAQTEKGKKLKIADMTGGSWQSKRTDKQLASTILEEGKVTRDGEVTEIHGYAGELSPADVQTLIGVIRHFGAPR